MNILKRFLLLTLVAALDSAGSTASAQYTLTTLVAFDGINGARPYCDLIADANGNLYGTTVSGNNVFELTAGSHTLATLATLNDTGGAFPYAGLITDADGNFYGTTYGGGVPGGLYGLGTIFKVASGTHAISTLVSFNGTNGQNPYCKLLADADGNLYGTTYSGTNNRGTVFEVPEGTHTLNTLATFDGTNGANPIAGLVADADGNLYGTTQQGGLNDHGTVFKLAAGTHALTTLVKFDVFTGYGPNANLLVAANGKLYGTTTNGGPIGSDGTVFEVDPDTGTLTTLASFSGANDGFELQSDLIADADGNVYGTTYNGGVFGLGTVYKIDANTHAITTLVSFDDTNGANPTAGLFMDANGNLYGTTSGNFGVVSQYGTVFELSPVPEPSSLVLGLLAMGGVLLLGRMRKRALQVN